MMRRGGGERASLGEGRFRCRHKSASFDRTLCGCGSMHDYCDDCGAALGCPLDKDWPLQTASDAACHAAYP
jgi:hypothetical protein